MYDSVIDTIGNTPLIRLKKASDLTGCEIYGKAEFLNPGQSVKDRAAIYIIRDAEERKMLCGCSALNSLRSLLYPTRTQTIM